MNISVNANYLVKTRDSDVRRSPEECMNICVQSGFTVLDYSPNIYCDEWEREIDAVMNAAEKLGVRIAQSHAPFNFYSRRSPELFAELLDRSAQAAVRMGISQLVFHADEYHPAEGTAFDPNAALNAVYDVIAPHVEKALKGGVKVALENIFEDHFRVGKNDRSHFCGELEELIAIIEKFNDPSVCCCWDFGHGKIAFGNEGHCDALRALGSKIICTHVHDNYYGKDLHLPPFMGDANWEELMPTLKDIGYNGDLTFELVYGNLADKCVLPFMKNLYLTGETLVKMFKGEK